MARFCPLFSGSSGNCTFIGTPEGGILVDAGVSAKRIETALWNRGVDMHSIRGIFVTHEHSDHTSGLRVLQKRYHIPIFASPGTREGLLEGALPEDADCRTMEEPVELAGMLVTAFHTPHDCRESTGFRVETPDGRTLAVATDMGHITPEIRAALTGCDLIQIESNHDIPMLEVGPYPYYLKRRFRRICFGTAVFCLYPKKTAGRQALICASIYAANWLSAAGSKEKGVPFS